MPKINQQKYLSALNFAYKLHKKQFRKDTQIPYFFHLSSVSNHIIENGGTTDEAIAGLLHDAVEDQGGEKTLKLIRKKFGNKVAKIVEDCTDTKIEPKPPSVSPLMLKLRLSPIEKSLPVTRCLLTLSIVIDALPDTDTSAACAETEAREPANADNPIFLKLFILITPCLLYTSDAADE